MSVLFKCSPETCPSYPSVCCLGFEFLPVSDLVERVFCSDSSNDVYRIEFSQTFSRCHVDVTVTWSASSAYLELYNKAQSFLLRSDSLSCQYLDMLDELEELLRTRKAFSPDEPDTVVPDGLLSLELFSNPDGFRSYINPDFDPDSDLSLDPFFDSYCDFDVEMADMEVF